jgi:hypothetical protein
MSRPIREYDPIRLTVALDEPEAGEPSNILHLPVGTEGSALIDWGDAFECLLALPADVPGGFLYAETSVRLDQMELLPLPPDHASGR